MLAFRKKVGDNRLLQFWDNPFELKSKIMYSLQQAIKILPRSGWIRGTAGEYHVEGHVSPKEPNTVKTSNRKIPITFDINKKVIITYRKVYGEINYKKSVTIKEMIIKSGAELAKGTTRKTFENILLKMVTNEPQSCKVSSETMDNIIKMLKNEKIIVDKNEQDLIIFTAKSRNLYIELFNNCS